MAKKEVVKKTTKKTAPVKPVGKKKPQKTSSAVTSKEVATDSKPKRSLLRKIFRSPFRGYFVSSWQELRKVEWPDRKTSWKLTFTVIFFSVFFSAFTAGLDVGFEKLAKQIFLK